MRSNSWPCFESAPGAARAASGSPSRRCTSSRIAHVLMANACHFGTAFSHAPAIGCDTATSRAASRADTAASSAHSRYHAPWCTI